MRACPASTTRERASSSAALAAGVQVTVLPGASAVETALVASGLSPRSIGSSATCRAREPSCGRCGRRLRSWPLRRRRVRVAATAGGVARELARASPDRQVAVCRELTKRFEEVVRGTAAELAARFREPVKGEVTIVVGAADPRAHASTPRAPSRRSASSSRRARRAGRQRTSSLASRMRPGTRCTAPRCRLGIDAVRRRRYPSTPALPAQRTKEVSRAPFPRARRDAPRGTCPERQRVSLVVARGRRGAPPVRARLRRLRRRAASRHRRRRRGRQRRFALRRPARSRSRAPCRLTAAASRS